MSNACTPPAQLSEVRARVAASLQFLGLWALLVSSLGVPSTLAASDDPRPDHSDGADSPKVSSVNIMNPEPFALIELYTSEGCSSCPPADELLARTVPRGVADTTVTDTKHGQRPANPPGDKPGAAPNTAAASSNVIALAFHVDYWDYLGWKDPYARAEFTARQRARAKAMNLSGLYTPQAVVNGVEEFVGSDASKMRNEVARALKAVPSVAIEATVETDSDPENRGLQKSGGSEAAPTDKDGASDQSTKPDKPGTPAKPATPEKPAKHAVQPVIDVTVRLSGLKQDATLCVALAQSGFASKVTRGENAGRTLKHDHVVREFRTIKVSPRDADAARISVPFPADCSTEQAEIVVFVEDPTTMATLAAKRLRVVEAK